eukprot:4753100-Ditylum_brightwellii.AAC.1
MEVLATLCNLSLGGCIGENRKEVLEKVNMSNLVSFLCSADSTYRLFGAVTIGNIASDLGLQPPVVKSGALTPLITTANSADLETQRCIAYAICNLAADESNRSIIVTEGGLPPLISLCCTGDENDLLAGLSTIRGLSASPSFRRHIIEAGVLEVVSIGAKLNSSLSCQREAASIISTLSLNELNKVTM